MFECFSRRFSRSTSATNGSNPKASRFLAKTSQCCSIPPLAPTSISVNGCSTKTFWLTRCRVKGGLYRTRDVAIGLRVGRKTKLIEYRIRGMHVNHLFHPFFILQHGACNRPVFHDRSKFPQVLHAAHP